MLASVLAQSDVSTTSDFNPVVPIIAILVGIALAFVPAVVASRKGHSFVAFFLFGLLCWLPALIVALVIADRQLPGAPLADAYASSTWQPAPPPGGGPPPGWYPDPGGSGQQRYWDGMRWTEHLA